MSLFVSLELSSKLGGMLDQRQYLLSLLGLVCACAGHDHTFHKVDDPNPPQIVPASLRIDLALQQNDWGNRTTRCQMQVAFEPLPEYTDPSDAAGGSPDPDAPAPRQMVLPTEAGSCAFTSLPPPPPPPDEEDGDLPPLDDDNWQLSGEVVGPTYIEMWGSEDSWTLDTTHTDHGGLRYEWTDCSVEDYPFSSTLTMDVPASPDPDGVHPFTMTELVPVGPHLRLIAPSPQEHGKPQHVVEEPLVIEWEIEGALPRIEGAAQVPETLVKIQTQDHERKEDTRWVICWPEEDGWIEMSPETLAPLFEGRTDPDIYVTHVDVHMEILGEDRPTPWGEALTVRTHTSSGAGIQARSIEDLEAGQPPP